jgi:hypothetical protein
MNFGGWRSRSSETRTSHLPFAHRTISNWAYLTRQTRIRPNVGMKIQSGPSDSACECYGAVKLHYANLLKNSGQPIARQQRSLRTP